jgi:hypothetical protein
MPQLKPPVLVFLVDAFRHDFLAEDITPNLAGLAADGLHRALQPILGYSDAIRATVFTGKYPDETGYWMEYCFRPESSPWRGLSRLAPLDRLPSDLALRVLKLAASGTVMPALARYRGSPRLGLRNMPFRAIEKFDFTLHQPMTAARALGHPSIFDLCVANGRPWAYLDSSKVRRGTDLLDQIGDLPNDVGLIFVYLHQVDMAAHLFGIASRLFWRRVTATDMLFGKLLRSVRRRFGEVETFVFSDHGMSVLLRQRGIPELITHPGFPDRFLVALDATMVRLWYLDQDRALADELRERVANRFAGRFLSSDDLARYHLQFGSRLYGDDIFLLNPGQGIFPNFHSYVKPKAMHAYEPCDRDQWGIFIGPSETAEQISNPVELTEVTALVQSALQGQGSKVP